MKDWIKKTDKDGTVRYVNPVFEKILEGIETPTERVGKSESITEGVTAPQPDATEIANQEKRVKAYAAQKYLVETDWYAHRKAETGKAIPEDILVKRAQARVDIEAGKV